MGEGVWLCVFVVGGINPVFLMRSFRHSHGGGAFEHGAEPAECPNRGAQL